jgi:hypothetical protein
MQTPASASAAWLEKQRRRHAPGGGMDDLGLQTIGCLGYNAANLSSWGAGQHKPHSCLLNFQC